MTYPVAVMACAKQLMEGLGIKETQEVLEREFGVRPTRETLRQWRDPTVGGFRNRRRNDRRREALRRERVFKLKDAGVSVSSIQRLMNADFPDEKWPRSRVERLLREKEEKTP